MCSTVVGLQVYCKLFSKVFVPVTHHDEMKGWFFKFVCPGNAMSTLHDRLLLLKNATVKSNLGVEEVCHEKYVNIAFNNRNNDMLVSTKSGEMIRQSLNIELRGGNVAQEWEMQDMFFNNNNIKPRWSNCNSTWGILNETTGKWSGAVGVIQRDEADYAISVFAVSHLRSQVGAFSPTHFSPRNWVTKSPEELSPTWNLFGLFTKVSVQMFLRFAFLTMYRACQPFIPHITPVLINELINEKEIGKSNRSCIVSALSLRPS